MAFGRESSSHGFSGKIPFERFFSLTKKEKLMRLLANVCVSQGLLGCALLVGAVNFPWILILARRLELKIAPLPYAH